MEEEVMLVEISGSELTAKDMEEQHHKVSGTSRHLN